MLRKAMDVLELFSPTHHELGVVETAQRLGKSKSTTSRWLSAMEQAGFLERDGASGRYRLSMRLAALGEVARQSTSLQRLARPAIHRLTAATGETSDLVVLTGQDAVNVDVVESPHPVKQVGWLGRRLPLHATAAGKALIAWRSRDEVLRLLPSPLPRFTSSTVTDPEALLAELTVVRRRGYSAALREFEEDLVGVAAPVRDLAGIVVAVLTIGAPVSRVPVERVPEVAVHVVREADSVSRGLGHR
jgi:DNA-binding IclR family transcriptional regulator